MHTRGYASVVACSLEPIGPAVPSDDAAPPSPARLLGLTVQIVAAHVRVRLESVQQRPSLRTSSMTEAA